MRPLPAPLPLDLALGLALAAWWLADVEDSTAAGVTSLALMTVPLGWRRVAPLAVMGLVAAGFAAVGLETEPAEPLAQLAALLVATFTVAAAAPTQATAYAGLVVALAGGLGEALLVGEDAGFIVLLIGSAWAAGAAVRRLHGRSAQLEEQTVMLGERAREAAARERERIARELHDVVSHSVSLMVVQAGAAEQVLRRDPAQAEHALQALQASGRAAVDDLRRMLGLLRGGEEGHPRSPQPGLAAVGGLIEPRDHGVRLELAEHPPLPPGVDLAAYRIVQEALTNARRHAAGRPTSVRVGWSAGSLELEIRTERVPDGPSPAPGTGHGLVGMRERVTLYDGEFHAGIDERGDWVVRATLPVEAT
jgi:signal transduction histidine kinase